MNNIKLQCLSAGICRSKSKYSRFVVTKPTGISEKETIIIKKRVSIEFETNHVQMFLFIQVRQFYTFLNEKH